MAYGETDGTVRGEEILVCAPFGRDAAVVAELARDAQFGARATRTPAALMASIEDGFGALVLTEEAFGAGLGEALDGWLRTQPVWAEAPILCLVDHASDLPPGLRRLLASEGRLDLVLLERPVRPATLVSAMRSLLKGRRGQYRIRDQMAELSARNDRLQFLLGELDHRVKNMLAKVSSIVTIAGSHAQDVETFTSSFKDRIRAMARAHDSMAGDRVGPVYLKDVIGDALSPFASPDRSNIRMSGPNLELWQLGGLTLAMVLHELATNAAKYGALSVPGGWVAVEWRLEPGDRPTLHLEWQESGGPPVARPSRRSFGTMLIDSIAPMELDGTVTLDFAPEGVRCVMDFPADDRVPVAPPGA